MRIPVAHRRAFMADENHDDGIGNASVLEERNCRMAQRVKAQLGADSLAGTPGSCPASLSAFLAVLSNTWWAENWRSMVTRSLVRLIFVTAGVIGCLDVKTSSFPWREQSGGQIRS